MGKGHSRSLRKGRGGTLSLEGRWGTVWVGQGREKVQGQGYRESALEAGALEALKSLLIPCLIILALLWLVPIKCSA